MDQRSLLKKIYWTSAVLALFSLVFFISIIFLKPSSVGNPNFISNINLWAAAWALNFVIVLLLLFTLARDLIKLLFDYQAARPGSRIKGKLVTTFVLFSLLPALIMSLLAFGLINHNLRLWFTSPSEQLLGSSDVIVSEYYEQNKRYALLMAQTAAARLRSADSLGWEESAKSLNEFGFGATRVFAPDGRQLSEIGDWIGDRPSPIIESVLAGEEFYQRKSLRDLNRPEIDLVVVGWPLRNQQGELIGALLGQRQLPQSLEFHSLQVGEAQDRINQLKKSVTQAEINYYLILILITLAVVFGFVWLGTYIARRLTVPLEALAAGARELAAGNLDHRVDVETVDELGVLVSAFNQMAEQIKASRRELEKANLGLKESNRALEERRQYIEMVLQNIATGVISVDESDRVRTINRAALAMLRTTAAQIQNRTLGELKDPDLEAELKLLRKRASLSGTYRKNISVTRGGHTVYIAATATANPLPLGESPESLIVLDDLTELIRAEKFAAWQEVARRLAHEIKNPLTPIQLSWERIRKRFRRLQPHDSAEMKEFSQVLQDGHHIIRAEAELLKTLVEEFSRFARLPISKPQRVALHPLIEQTLALYSSANGVEIQPHFDPEVDDIWLDPEQMRRVFKNLIENSLDALSENPGRNRIEVSTRLNRKRESVTIEFSDNGNGIAPEDYEKLFLPYFSTKKKGTGLGLAITRQIVSEHNGFIRAEPNHPRGMKFTLDIPLQ